MNIDEDRYVSAHISAAELLSSMMGYLYRFPLPDNASPADLGRLERFLDALKAVEDRFLRS